MTGRAIWFLPLACCVVVSLVGNAPAAQQKETIHRTIKADHVEQVLKDLNIANYKKSQPANLPDDVDFDFTRNRHPYRFTVSRGKLLWISVYFAKAPLETINRWNTQTKFSRAVLDRLGDREFAVIEYQVDASGGVTLEMIRQMMRRFDEEVLRFEQFLRN